MRITEESMKQKNPELNGPAGLTPDFAASAPTAKQQPMTEREKLKTMNFKDKIWYIWSYYKWFFAGAAIVCFLISSIGQAAYRMTFQTALHIVAINGKENTETHMQEAAEDFHIWLGLGKKDRVTTETLFMHYEDAPNEYTLANMTKLSTLAAAQELDVVIGDAETFDYYAPLGAFQNLSQTLPPDILESVKERLFYAVNENGETCACAIDISGTPFAEKNELSQKPALLGIMNSSQRSETALALIQYILNP